MSAPFTLTKEQIANIRAEYKRGKMEIRPLNPELFEQTLTNWETWRPQMYRYLKGKGLLKIMATVCQWRMRDEERRNLDAGMYCTDAHEQAFAATMMWGEPEDEADDILGPGDPLYDLTMALREARCLVRESEEREEQEWLRNLREEEAAAKELNAT